MDVRELVVTVDDGSVKDSTSKTKPDLSNATCAVLVVLLLGLSMLLGWFISDSVLDSSECHFCDFALNEDQVWRDLFYTCPDCGKRQPDVFSADAVLVLNMIEFIIVYLVLFTIVAVVLSGLEKWVFKRELVVFRKYTALFAGVIGFVWSVSMMLGGFFGMARIAFRMFEQGM